MRNIVLLSDYSSAAPCKWVPFLEDPQHQSYSYLLRCQDQDHHISKQSASSAWASQEQLDTWFDALHPSNHDVLRDGSKETFAWTDSYYKGEKLLRKTAWVTFDERCECEYGYSDTWQAQSTSAAFVSTILEISKAVMDFTGYQSFNCCNLNYYPEGGGVGFHADDEFLFDGRERATTILSLSLCRSTATGIGARKFQVKFQKSGVSEDDAQESTPDDRIHEVILRHGDLLTMEGLFQRHYFHSVWPGDSKKYMDHELTQGERINLTWRTIVKHLDGSSECRGKVCPLSSSGP